MTIPGVPNASIVIPTRGRPEYLDVTLASVMDQAQMAGAEVLVVLDGPDPDSDAVARRRGARVAALDQPRGLNAARNRGIATAGADLIAFLDDDVEVEPGWLSALLQGVRSAPEHGVFGGPIRARLEGGGPRACGREAPPITTLDLGSADADVAFVWGANMAIRRSAYERVGPFDERLAGRGDEEDWERRYRAAGGRVRYLAGAGIVHRRSAADARLRVLARAAYALGRTARRNDVRKGTPPSTAYELRVLAGCAWHTVRRRCAYGIVMGAHTLGRIRELLDPQPEGPDFLSGTAGEVSGVRATSRAVLADSVADAVAGATLLRPRLVRAASGLPRRRVLVLAIEHEDTPNLLANALAGLGRSRHELTIATTTVGGRGKFENVGRLLEAHPPAGHDWLLLLDDDVGLPPGFLDAFLFLAERFSLQIAQPAHRHRSHAGWSVTRRRLGSVARETGFVEIGPVVAFSALTFDVVLPFPPLRFGWGLDHHWSAVAAQRSWRIGVIDATPIEHGLRKIAASYDRTEAVEEARQFLSGRPYTTREQAQRTLAVHRSWR
jgi:GT2 family glycosyltransferase